VACTFGDFHRIRCDLEPRGGGSAVATAILWSADPISWRPGERSVGLVDVDVASPLRRQGLATFLLGEALRQVQQHGFTTAEAQVLENNEPAGQMLKRLGFQEVGRGAVYRKEVP
jgi:ribosomal protein S18 acetylase RimI-like enzyme